MPLVSIVVPAYNAENTLERTISDILAQTFQDYELIIVDDGSTDATSQLCDKISKEDQRIQVIHQKNGGLSNARNNGTKVASGKYVTYIDSDDRVESYYLEYLVRGIIEEKADIACGRIDRVKENCPDIHTCEEYSVESFDTRETLSEMLTGKKLTVGACCRLVPRIWQLRYPFLENTYYEDLSNTYKINMLSNKTVFINSTLYHYVMRGGSITGRKVTSVKQCCDYFNAIKACHDTIIVHYPELANDAAVLKARDCMSLYLNIKRCNEQDEELECIEKEINSWMRKNWKKAMMNKKAPLEVRLRILLYRISPKIYKRVYYLGIKIKGKAIN